MHLCGGAIEEPSVKGIDGSRFGLREQSVGAVAVTSARREHGAGEREAHLSERKGLGAFAVSKNRVGLCPPAESYEPLRSESVEVATKTAVEPRQSRLGRSVEHLVDGLLVGAAHRGGRLRGRAWRAFA